jgi:hypothetical protein
LALNLQTIVLNFDEVAVAKGLLKPTGHLASASSASPCPREWPG